MNFKTLVLTLATISVACAQQASILSPPAGATLTPGSNVTVQISSAEGLTGFEQVSVAIGLGPTDGNSSTLGTVLFMGMFNPQRHDMNQPAYQNFTVTIPSAPSGSSQLNIAHFYLVGAGLEPVLETKNTSVMVAN